MTQTPPGAETYETHTGIVFLTGDRALKMKKPVDFGFCDFTTLQARRTACEREVELNRRLAPDVYLGVGELVLPGRPGEPLVAMRRMPAEARLSTMVRSGHPTTGDIRRVARLVATFHERCHHGPAVTAEATRDALWARWEDNLAEASRFHFVLDAADLRAIESATADYLAGRRSLFDHRIATDRIVDGHGDLQADDIFCLPDGPRILDCLEFDDRLRYVDRIDDIAFLAMDLERLGTADLGRRLLDDYREFSGDTAPPSLVHHYIAYRAFVRAKVAGIRYMQGDADARRLAGALTGLARRHLEAGAVRLVLVGGLPGTGKSTLAGHIADELGYTVLRSDRIRKELAGLVPEQPAPAAYREGLYTGAHTGRTYGEMFARAERLLALGESVVLDASWTDAAARGLAAEVADRARARLVPLLCVTPVDIAAARIARRHGPSDANPAIAEAMRANAAPWPEAHVIDTTEPPAAAAQAAIAHIHPAPACRTWPSRRAELQPL